MGRQRQLPTLPTHPFLQEECCIDASTSILSLFTLEGATDDKWVVCIDIVHYILSIWPFLANFQEACQHSDYVYTNTSKLNTLEGGLMEVL